MTAGVYQVAVIGGGIHGVGVAQAAAAMGYSVVVLEQHSLAHGTSSRSSKLIHGGLRYLEQGQLRLVRECLHERNLLLKNAPELVRRVPFYIPVYDTTTRSAGKIGVGLGLYALLGGGGFSRLARPAWAGLDGLHTDRLRTVYRYWDAQTDDAALTRAVMHSAASLGAELLCPAQVTHIVTEVTGCTVSYTCGGREESIYADVVVNAAGPWVNQVLARATPAPVARPVALVQGAHLLVPGARVGGVYYIESPADGRAVFVMPWQEGVLVGTTETLYSGDPGAVMPLEQERRYLWDTLCHYFPLYRRMALTDVLSFAGLRVLPAEGGSAFTRPRETILQVEGVKVPRLLTIYGGKLTAYRATAQAVMARLRTALPAPHGAADTARLALRPCE